MKIKNSSKINTLKRINLMNLNNQKLFYVNKHISLIIFLILLSNLIPIILNQINIVGEEYKHILQMVVTFWIPLSIIAIIIILIRRSIYLSSRSNINVNVMNIPVNKLTDKDLVNLNNPFFKTEKEGDLDTVEKCKDAIGPFAEQSPQSSAEYTMDTKRLISIDQDIAKLQALKEYVTTDRDIYFHYIEKINNIINQNELGGMEFDSCADHSTTFPSFKNKLLSAKDNLTYNIYQTIVQSDDFSKKNQDIVKSIPDLEKQAQNKKAKVNCTNFADEDGCSDDMYCTWINNNCVINEDISSSLQRLVVEKFLKKYNLDKYFNNYITHIENKIAEADIFDQKCSTREQGMGLTSGNDTYS